MPVIVIDYRGPIATEAIMRAIREAAPGAGVCISDGWIEPEIAQMPPEAAADEPSPPPSQFERLVHEVAKRLEPGPDQLARRRFLRGVYLGLDSLDMAEGNRLWNVTGASSGLGRLLRPLFPNDKSPLDRIVTRDPIKHQNGKYMATKYIPTSLGYAVLKILADKGALDIEEFDPAEVQSINAMIDDEIAKRPEHRK